MSRVTILTNVILLVLLGACSLEPNKWEGIWHTEFEPLSDFNAVVEFELKKEFLTDDWSGTWQAPEIMAFGELYNITATDSSIEMHLDPGSTHKLECTLSKGNEYLDVYYTNPIAEDEERLRFVKVENWTSQMPARINQDNQVIKLWKYQIPQASGDGWQVSSLYKAALPLRSLEGLFQRVIDGEYQGLDAVLMSIEGELVLEEYFHLGGQDRIHSMQSMTKSVTSLLIGKAIDDSYLSDIDLPIQSFFPDYKQSFNGNEWPITVRHALMMAGGLVWTENIPYTDPLNDAIRMNNSEDLYEFVLSREMAVDEVPGKEFKYNSGLSVLLGGVILDVTGLPIDEYAEQTLFGQLGIDTYYWQYFKNVIHTGGGLFMLPRDILKLGQLVLDNGVWNGEQVLSRAWIEESTANILPMRGTNRNWGYGYQWVIEEFMVDGKQFSSIFANGYGWQFLWIVPDLDLVVLVLHHNPTDLELNHSIHWKEMEDVIIPTVLHLNSQ